MAVAGDNPREDGDRAHVRPTRWSSLIYAAKVMGLRGCGLDVQPGLTLIPADDKAALYELCYACSPGWEQACRKKA